MAELTNPKRLKEQKIKIKIKIKITLAKWK
jgi:hypothetical protein